MLPVEVLVAAQVLQFHSLDLVVVEVKLIQAVWKILQTQSQRETLVKKTYCIA